MANFNAAAALAVYTALSKRKSSKLGLEQFSMHEASPASSQLSMSSAAALLKRFQLTVIHPGSELETARYLVLIRIICTADRR